MIEKILLNYGFCFDDMKKKDKAKTDKNIKLLCNILFLLNIITDMFEYNHMPGTLDFVTIELLRLTNGHCGLVKKDNEVYVCVGSFSDEVSRVNGIGKKYVGTLLDGTQVEGIINEDIILIKNNNTMSPDITELYQIADNMTETDISIMCNLLYTRLLPIFKVSNDKQKSAIEKAFENALNGKLNTFLSDLTEIDLDGKIKSVEKFEFTQPQEVDKIQYLTKYYDDIMRRFYTKWGHSMAGTQKMAQQNNSEISMNDTISMIYPTERLNCLKTAIEKANEKFGTEIEVRFSECWRVRAEKTEENTSESETEVLENISRETFKGGKNNDN